MSLALSRAERLLVVQERLLSAGALGLSPVELAKELGVHRTQIYRDLRSLKKMGKPVRRSQIGFWSCDSPVPIDEVVTRPDPGPWKGQRKPKHVGTMLTAEQYDQLSRVAKADGVSLGRWIRATVVAALLRRHGRSGELPARGKAG